MGHQAALFQITSHCPGLVSLVTSPVLVSISIYPVSNTWHLSDNYWYSPCSKFDLQLAVHSGIHGPPAWHLGFQQDNAPAAVRIRLSHSGIVAPNTTRKCGKFKCPRSLKCDPTATGSAPKLLLGSIIKVSASKPITKPVKSANKAAGQQPEIWGRRQETKSLG